MLAENKGAKIKVFIIEDDLEVRRSLLGFLGNDEKISIFAFFTSGVDIISAIKTQKPDIVITDFLATDINNIKILKIINSKLGTNRPKIIVTSYTDDVKVLEESFKLGTDYFIKKPIILSLLKDTIFLVSKGSDALHRENSITHKIKGLINLVGVPANVLGYIYIESALSYMINSNKIMFLTEIYREISIEHNTSINCVEINIRNAIKKAAKAPNSEFKNMFGFCKCRPSNSIFLSTLREKLLIEKF